MSLLNQLAPKAGSKHSPKRIGRGIGSGMGGTATKGHKGQLARTGGKVRRGFEGGQTPMHRRLPKFGFSNVAFANNFEIVNVGQLAKFSGVVTPESLHEAGLTNGGSVKILGNGELKVSLTVKA
ncbi:MAG TPA: 50S ribosomal protein L15, partial [Bdellovibrio sp.]|nr:50S ribosomal protein L15 [Bdellovibrio sp.]